MNSKKNKYKWMQSITIARFSSLIGAIAIFSISLLSWQPPASAILAQGDAVTDPQAILRYSLPIDNKPVRKLQESLEDISNQLRAKRWRNIGRDISDASLRLVC